MKGLLRRLAEYRLGTIIVFLSVTAYFGATQPHFLEATNIMAMAREYAEIGVIAVGMTLVIATGGIDISVGGIVGMASMVIGVLFATLHWNIWLAAAAGMGASGVIGALNGFAVAYMGVQPVLVTLATMSLTRGIAYILTSGTSLSVAGAGFQAVTTLQIGTSTLGIPVPAVIMAAAFVGAAVILHKTTYGRRLLALGQSEPAARLSGVPVRRTKFSAYLALGLLSGVGAILLTSRLATAFPDAGRNYEFETITAVVLGGTSLTGGEGSLLGTLIGVATMAALRNGLSLSGQSDLISTQMLAVALIAAVVIDNLRKRLVYGGQQA